MPVGALKGPHALAQASVAGLGTISPFRLDDEAARIGCH